MAMRAVAGPSWYERWVQLNPTQQAAVEHRGGPVLVLAGAGTGKTRVITQRIAALLAEGVPAWRILAVTFTNKAAREMRERIEVACESLPDHVGRDVGELWVGTFHAICARILRRHGDLVGLTSNFTIYDTGDQKTLMKRVLRELEISERLYTPQSMLSLIDAAKNKGVSLRRPELLDLGEPVRSVMLRAWERYELRLRQADAVDFGGLLTATHQLLQQKPDAGAQLADFDPVARLRSRFQHVVVDEFQDTNAIQASIVENLAQAAELCVVGDDDQSIYGWRGADVEQFLSFSDRHPGCELVRLEQNYRSTGHILNCADGIIARNPERLGKKLWTSAGEGRAVRLLRLYDEREEARFVAREAAQAIAEGTEPTEVAVFYRTHAQSRAIEEAFRSEALRYQIVGGLRFYDRAEIKDLIAYLRLLVNPRADVDVARVINRPARGIGAKTVERLTDFATAQEIGLLEACERVEEVGLGAAARKRVAAFAQLVAQLQGAMADEERTLDGVARLVLEDTGYLEQLRQSEEVDAETRRENLREFVGALAEYAEESQEPSLVEFLEQVSLATDQDNSGAGGAVSLMTVHSAKGLEFERVYITGLEEGVFPHMRSLEDPQQMAEERRLAYVAVTRARIDLCVTSTSRRMLYGQAQVNAPSRFVSDMPRESVMSGASGARAAGAQRGVSGRGPKLAFGEPSATAASSPKQEPAWNSDIELDEGFGLEEGEGASLFKGMGVRHAKYGVGDVQGWDGEGANLKLRVRFSNAGTKTILARFCEPL